MLIAFTANRTRLSDEKLFTYVKRYSFRQREGDYNELVQQEILLQIKGDAKNKEQSIGIWLKTKSFSNRTFLWNDFGIIGKCFKVVLVLQGCINLDTRISDLVKSD